MPVRLRVSLAIWALGVLFGEAGCAADPVSPETRQLLRTFVSEFVEIRPGEDPYPADFQPGEAGAAERPPVQLKPFSMAKYEVPQNLYEAVMGTNPSRWKGPRNSVEMLTFAEAEEFCKKITRLLHAEQLLPAEQQIRLPSELEWEYACRAGTSTAYSFGDAAQAPGDVAPKATLLDKFAWHTGNAAGNDPPVGALAPNPWGLYDMHGYLWEFCTSTNELKPGTCIVCGGSWKDPFPLLKSSSRKSFPLAGKDDAVGFRCVRQ